MESQKSQEPQEPKYPYITVELIGQNGNAFVILGRIMKAMKKAGIPQFEITQFQEEATSGDYDHLLEVCCRWVNVE
ncbi:MAG: hypothetical protein ACXACY_13315 [Candidatus Hodarchaeales archaeon]|jgi:hypothetical protein